MGHPLPDYSPFKATTGEPQCLAEILTVSISNENSAESLGFGPTYSQAVPSAREVRPVSTKSLKTRRLICRCETLLRRRVTTQKGPLLSGAGPLAR